MRPVWCSRSAPGSHGRDEHRDACASLGGLQGPRARHLDAGPRHHPPGPGPRRRRRGPRGRAGGAPAPRLRRRGRWGAAGLDRSHLSRWESERCDHPAPLAVLWSRALVSDEAFEALVAQARADRAAQGAPADAAAPEDALVVLLRRVSAVVGDGAVALRDGRLDPAELRALRPQVQDVGRAAARLLRAVDHVLGAADTAKVVHLRGVR